MMRPLPSAFLDRPIAHRGLHGLSSGQPENSLSAFEAAISAGYGIELDLQLSADGVAMVFHDYALDRLTGAQGALATRTAAELGRIALKDGEGACIPTLAQVLTRVAGRVPLLIELKDQDGALGPKIGALEAAVAQDLHAYQGAAALMSFNPHSIIALAKLAPQRPRGLTTCAFDAEDWKLVPAARRTELRLIVDYDRADCCFVSHDRNDLTAPRVAALAEDGAAILCWTVRSARQEAAAREIAHNITFEGYLA
ncbi:glycerophosphodiester phosphodiesterase family protein [Primorskyibacter flagellatus]|uniref:glycerophosphodiester phosphodiesterase family protein n=1 Tax=Primorskyibacter flagellatus TaxID=1387277 RepID=UPI003A8F36AE